MSQLPDGWRKVSLSQILRKVRRPVDMEHDKLYYQIGIRSHSKGIFHKEPVNGAEIGTKRIFWIKPGDLVLNIVFAWEGAVALVSEAETGMCASHRFPTFVAEKNECDIRFILRYFQTPRGIWDLGLASPGGAGRNRTLNQEDFLNLSISLPPLPEQRKIAQILSTWDEAIQVVEALIAALKARKRGLMQRLLTGEVRFPGFDGEWEEVRLGEITEINPRKPSRIRDDLQVSFVGMADVSDDARLMTSDTKTYSEVSNGFTYFQDQDVLIAKITPCLENGKGALVSGLLNSIGFGSTEFHVLRANPEKVLPEYIYYHSISYPFRQRGARNMVGSAGQKRIQTSFVFSYPVLLPSIEEQSKIIEILNQANETEAELAEYVVLLREQKKGLMQRLLTGEVRVKV